LLSQVAPHCPTTQLQLEVQPLVVHEGVQYRLPLHVYAGLSASHCENWQ